MRFDRLMVDHAPMVMMVVDRDRRDRAVNAAGARFADRAEEEMIGLRGGEALKCVYSVQSPEGCGHGPECRNCFVRRTVVRTFEEQRSFREVEGTLWFMKRDGRHSR